MSAPQRDRQYLSIRDTLLRGVIGRIAERLDRLDSDGDGLPDGSVVTATLADRAVTTIKLALLAVTSEILAASAVITSKLADLAVTTAKIDNAAVTPAKLAASVAGAGLTGGAGSALDVNAGAGLEVSSDAVRIAAAAAGAGLTGGAGSALAVGAGSFVTVNADDVQVSAGGQALWQGAPSFTVGAEAADTIRVSVQLKDAGAVNLAAATLCTAWLSDTAGGAVTVAAAAAMGVATGGVLVYNLLLGSIALVSSNSSGFFDIDIMYVGAHTYYLNIEWGGRVYTSGAIAFA